MSEGHDLEKEDPGFSFRSTFRVLTEVIGSSRGAMMATFRGAEGPLSGHQYFLDFAS
jgi:hypothetical protein